MKLYMDKGQKSDQSDDVVTVAAAIFSGAGCRRFEKGWRGFLKGWKASAFHATDFYNGRGEFERETPAKKARFERDCRRLPGLVGTDAHRLIAVAFRPAEFKQTAPESFRARYGESVHSLAAQIVLIVNGWLAIQEKYTHGFTGFMESGDDDESRVLDTVRAMRADAKTGPHLQLDSFLSVKKGKAKGLEAADFLAWHWNKYYMDTFRQETRGEKGRDIRKDFAAVARLNPEKMYQTIITAKKLQYFLDGAPSEGTQ
jgi:hypothetical protein